MSAAHLCQLQIAPSRSLGGKRARWTLLLAGLIGFSPLGPRPGSFPQRAPLSLHPPFRAVARFGLPLSRRVRVLSHMVDYHNQTIELPSEEEAAVAAQ